MKTFIEYIEEQNQDNIIVNLLTTYYPQQWKQMPDPKTYGMSVNRGAANCSSGGVPEIATVNGKNGLGTFVPGSDDDGTQMVTVDRIIRSYGGIRKMPFVNDVTKVPESHHIILIHVFFDKHVNEIYYDDDYGMDAEDFGVEKDPDIDFWGLLTTNWNNGRHTSLSDVLYIDAEKIRKATLYGTCVTEIKPSEIQEIKYYICDDEKLELYTREASEEN